MPSVNLFKGIGVFKNFKTTVTSQSTWWFTTEYTLHKTLNYLTKFAPFVAKKWQSLQKHRPMTIEYDFLNLTK